MLKSIFNYKNYLVLFCCLLIAYFAIGTYSIQNLPITTDEIAHLSAAQAITQGQDLNLEHPPLLKSLNAAVINAFFSDYKSDDLGQWSRSIDFMIFGPYGIDQILQASRTVYLVFNSALLIFLLIYTCYFNLLPKKFSLVLGILYTFSPSFFGQNFLLTFDTAGAIFESLLSILSLLIFIYNYIKLDTKQRWLHFSILVLCIFTALNVKFSNYIILGIFAAFLGILAIYFAVKKDFGLTRTVFLYSTVASLILFAATWSLTFVAYRNGTPVSNMGIPLQSSWYTDPIIRIHGGAIHSLNRSENSIPNFVDDHFEVISFGQFINRIFWFKENPGLLLFLLFILLGILSLIYLKRHNLSQYLQTSKNYLQTKYKYIYFSALALALPIIYYLIAKNSTLTIGYRHFYTVLLFIYFGVAWLVYLIFKQKKVYLDLSCGFVLVIYIICGIFAVPQGLTYVNDLWTKPKWQLATDSTISWKEEQGKAINYLVEKQIIKQKSGDTWNVKFDIDFGPSFLVYFAKVTGKGKKLETIDRLSTDLKLVRISDLQDDYLVVDINTLQNLSDEIWKSQQNKSTDKESDDRASISRQNLKYLLQTKPIYQANKVVFIYSLK